MSRSLNSLVEVMWNGLDGIDGQAVVVELMDTNGMDLNSVIGQLDEAGETRSLSFGAKAQSPRTRVRCRLNGVEVFSFELSLAENKNCSITTTTLRNLSKQKLRERVQRAAVTAAPPTLASQEIPNVVSGDDSGGFHLSLVNPGAVQVENYGRVLCQPNLNNRNNNNNSSNLNHFSSQQQQPKTRNHNSRFTTNQQQQQKDASAGGAASVLWMELREGTPNIRAPHAPAATASKALGTRTRKPAPVVTLPPRVSSKGPLLTPTTPPRTAATRKRPLDCGEAPTSTSTAPAQGLSHAVSHAVSQVSSSSQVAIVEYSTPPSPKRVRYDGHTLRPAEESPVLHSLDPLSHLEPFHHVPPPLDLSMLPASPPPVPKRTSVDRAHSLALGSGNDYDNDDKNDTDADCEFVNPFEDETYLHSMTNEATATICSSVQHPPEPPRLDSWGSWWIRTQTHSRFFASRDEHK